MVKKLFSVLSKVVTLGVASAGLYHTYYNKKYPMIVDRPDEHVLDRTEGEVVDDLELDWLFEANFTNDMVGKVVPYLSGKVKNGELDQWDYKLAYQTYQLDDAIATVIIVHGFNEYKEKFQEMIYYFLQRKIQVVVYDQRGHGDSKLTAQQTQVDSQNFNEYVLDLKAIINQVAQAILSDDQKLIIFSHSMGGAVTTSYLEQYPGQVDGAILNTPMFMIDTGKYPQSFTYLYSKLMAKLGYGRLYIPTTEAFDPKLHTIYDETPEGSISNSQIREEYFHKVNVSIHSLPTRGGSLNWLKTAFDTTHSILKPDRLAQVKIPILLIRAGEDNVVQKEGIFTAGHYLPNVERVLIPDSKHQTYLEHDQALRLYVKKLLEFIYNV